MLYNFKKQNFGGIKMGKITYNDLRYYAYSNDVICARPIKGIVVDFFGLGATVMYDEDTPLGCMFAEKGVLLLIPYNNPWAWMNPQAVAYTDELIDVLFDKYGLSEDTPIVSSGFSMGGLSAIVYCTHSKRTPVRCVANCPVCDLPFHFTERPDLPRTIYSAFFYADDFDKALEEASPLHLAQKGLLPDIDYHIFHCSKDSAVNISAHSERFIAAMNGKRVCYTVVPDQDHCQLPQKEWDMYISSLTAPFED